VRFIGNRSSGKQGHAIAIALQQAGADVTLITGPVALPDPPGIRTIRIETAQNMLNQCEKTLPVDIAICAAAVSDWRPENTPKQKIKKSGGKTPEIKLIPNPDILGILSKNKKRPRLVIGFAAETQNLLENARQKLSTKKCDWILANNISKNLFGSDENQIYLVSGSKTEKWEKQSKHGVAQKLVARIVEHFAHDRTTDKTRKRGPKTRKK
jgi:phosphopantothenoylcysteine decarboxylase/phosphopantothenate--cysteine ligase